MGAGWVGWVVTLDEGLGVLGDRERWRIRGLRDSGWWAVEMDDGLEEEELGLMGW